MVIVLNLAGSHILGPFEDLFEDTRKTILLIELSNRNVLVF